MNKSSLYNIVDYLGKKKSPRFLTVNVLYSSVVQIVKSKREEAKKKFRGGIPDAKNFNVEFKFGIDSIGSSQFVWNILNGHKGKIRWALSADSFEEALKGRKNKSILFESYLDYLLACEESEELELKKFRSSRKAMTAKNSPLEGSIAQV